jgi:selenocysteine lyase/cysteine desulfurase
LPRAAAAVEFLASLTTGASRRERLADVFDELHRRQHEMFKAMWDGLSSIPGITVYGPPPEEKRTSTVSFSVTGYKSEDVARKLAEQGLFLSDGDFYAATVVEKIGVGGLVRLDSHATRQGKKLNDYLTASDRSRSELATCLGTSG